MSNNLVGEMPIGAVDLGGSNKAASVGYPLGAINFGPSYSSTEDAMARSIVRLECEAEELRAEVALLREERNILARGKAAVTEGVEPACNDSAQAFRERPEPSPHLSDTPETDEAQYGTGRVSVEFARRLERERDEAREMLERTWHEDGAPLLQMMRERDEARVQFSAAEGLGMALVKTIDELRTEKAELTVKLVNLQAGSRPATLEEIRDSVREKHDPEHEFGGRDE